MITQK